jgi:hypothetical protein
VRRSVCFFVDIFLVTGWFAKKVSSTETHVEFCVCDAEMDLGGFEDRDLLAEVELCRSHTDGDPFVRWTVTRRPLEQTISGLYL